MAEETEKKKNSLSVTDFFLEKSVKLSDSYIVTITEAGKEAKELTSCCGFTLPKLEYNEETVKYGNSSQVILIPKYDNLMTVTLDIYEDSEGSIRKMFFTDLTNGFKIGNSLTVKQTYNQNGYTSNSVTYNVGQHDLSDLKITILSNNLKQEVLTYHFKNLKIVNFKQYELSHAAEDICKWSITFDFETYNKEYHL